ncbi:unnamed protein product [Pylaiella littoralis]
MCRRQQNAGEQRFAVQSDRTNPTHWDHFCYTCWHSEAQAGRQAERRGAYDGHGTLGNRGIGGGDGASPGRKTTVISAGESKGKGSQSKKPAKPPSPAAVAAAFREKFPQAPICTPVDDVETRARAAMHPTAATLAIKEKVKNHGADMGELIQEAAMAVFATIHVIVAVYAHEIISFKHLVLTPDGDESVKMICPSCLTNEFVETPGVSGNGFPSVSSQKIRVVHDIDGLVVVVCGKYRCKNPDCKSNIDSAQALAKKAEASGGKKVSEIEWDAEAVRSYCKHGVSFNAMDERYMKLLSAAVVAQLPYRLFKQNGTSERLLDMVRATEGDMQNLRRLLVARDQGQEIRAMQRYLRFVLEGQATEKSRTRLDGKFTKWSRWRFNHGTLISTPSVAVLNTFYRAGHVQDKDHMLCEIISEGDGEFVNGDGTFRAAGRVMDDSGCHYFVMGDDGKIQAYVAVKSESEVEILPLFKGYAKRREKKTRCTKCGGFTTITVAD